MGQSRRRGRSARRHGGRERDRAPLGDRREAVADPRRLAGEHDPPAGLQHAVELRERALEIGQVVEHGVAEHEVEAGVRERQRLRVGPEAS